MIATPPQEQTEAKPINQQSAKILPLLLPLCFFTSKNSVKPKYPETRANPAHSHVLSVISQQLYWI
jgi:hypothetical protein